MLIKQIACDCDLQGSYIATFGIPARTGCPSGLTGRKAAIALAQRVLMGEPVTLYRRGV